ncbi:hypothetical protein JDV02_000829 [Purpureocillium takamizusanense]|uniref:N-acetyltransferase domain-containing protein n=1 Tax=Purpureocillium takamizusanense TaxID=2060973 RepID=A0A9Q8Q6Y8_9HYPO|nr:uncharacterized protein JDV02_000829 [Purpureocillium takamizusanense]UNI14170.1 hypothetical protein JDV02_000829 [Purpureocillium takamizusanense]
MIQNPTAPTHASVAARACLLLHPQSPKVSLMPGTNQFRVRHARSSGDDAQFIVGAFDSTIPYLASIGAGGMWGEEPFSAKDGFEAETIESIQKSERDDEPLRVFIAEVDVGAAAAPQGTAQPPVRVGSAMIREDSLPSYITEREEMKPEVDGARDFLFLEVVISDYRTGSLHKGAGAALIEAIKSYGRDRNKRTLYVDCWAGNDAKLSRYYEKLGFTRVGDFSFGRASGAIWPGTFFRMDL